jgi:hypothetical protein
MRKFAMLNLAGAAVALLLAVPAMASDKPVVPGNSWPTETLSGKIDFVEPVQRVVVVESKDKVLYDIVIGAGTCITADDHAVAVRDLEHYQNKDVTVEFVPQDRGDIAMTISITG